MTQKNKDRLMDVAIYTGLALLTYVMVSVNIFTIRHPRAGNGAIYHHFVEALKFETVPRYQ